MEYDESTFMNKGKIKILKKYTDYNLLILDEWLLEGEYSLRNELISIYSDN